MVYCSVLLMCEYLDSIVSSVETCMQAKKMQHTLKPHTRVSLSLCLTQMRALYALTRSSLMDAFLRVFYRARISTRRRVSGCL